MWKKVQHQINPMDVVYLTAVTVGNDDCSKSVSLDSAHAAHHLNMHIFFRGLIFFSSRFEPRTLLFFL